MTQEVLVTVDDAARRLGLGRSKTYELVLSGALASVKVGRARRVPVRALAEFVTRLQAEAEAEEAAR